VENITSYYSAILANQGVYNIAAVAVETGTGAVRAYIGSSGFKDSLHQGQVDGVQAHRSTGSLLKPLLTACVLDRGPFNLHSRLLDVPTYYGTFSPQNASKSHGGLVTLRTSLVQSLNVPFARLLAFYGIHDFYRFLQKAGMKHLFRPADQYGLPLILGGAEASLWELTGMFNLLAFVHPAGPGCLEDGYQASFCP
jgi:penicillin-binding protein 1C